MRLLHVLLYYKAIIGPTQELQGYSIQQQYLLIYLNMESSVFSKC
jgi:hypothetical protein